MATRLVELVGSEVRGVEEGVSRLLFSYTFSADVQDTQDDLRFLRIRTKKHELMITPGSSFRIARIALSRLTSLLAFNRRIVHSRELARHILDALANLRLPQIVVQDPN